MFISTDSGEKSGNMCDLDENSKESKINAKNHYHLVERNTTAINIMSGIKSLVCDLNGIIIAEMVYRCMICDVIYETIPDVQIHYQTKHIDPDLKENKEISKTSTAKSNESTNVSFLNSFQLSTDSNSENTSDSTVPQTLTFDVPSGLKTLQQQFESSSKEIPQKKKNNKSLSSNNSKTKINFSPKSRVLGHMSGPTIKSGFITCEICGATKFYKYTQRRFGVYSCVGCAKFYSKYLIKPTAYKMCENLGKCNLKVSECEPNGRCKACLIHKCKSKFIIDPKKLSNYSKIGPILSRNDSNGSKFKTNVKQISSKELNRSTKSKTLNTSLVETKSKSSSPSNKTKPEMDSPNNKLKTCLVSNKKLKSDKTYQKNTNEKNGFTNKKNTNTSGLSKGRIFKKPLLKKNSVKTNGDERSPKRTRNQSFCRKCFGSKDKDCSNCGIGLDSNKAKDRDKSQQNSIKTICLTRSRNK